MLFRLCIAVPLAALLTADLTATGGPAACGADAVRQAQGSQAQLVHTIDAALDAPGIRTGFTGVLVQSATDGRTLFARNAERLFLPASNEKLFTAAAALALLGPGFTYRTRVVATGAIRRGRLCGDLVIVGAGDPTLSVADMDALARQVRDAGVQCVAGKLLYDDSLFDSQRLGEGWSWDDESAYYSAQISALNVNENVEAVRVSPASRPGRRVRVDVDPSAGYVHVRNTAVTAPQGSARDLTVDRLRARNVITVTGSIPEARSAGDAIRVWVTVENPSRFAAEVFAAALERQGVRIHAVAPARRRPAGADAAIAAHVSSPLPQILAAMLKPSDNFIAECLIKTIGATVSGTGTSGFSGTGEAAARTWCRSIGLDSQELIQVDGSGLSRMDYVSPANIVRLLTYLRSQPYFPILYDGLPVAGVDGTLRHRMLGTAAAGNCHAKTGSLSHVSTISGYLTTRDGVPLVFSILLNNFPGGEGPALRAEDAIVEALADWRETGSSGR